MAGATGKAADAGHQHTLVGHDHSTANKGGAIPESSVTNLTSDLAAKAATASPTFTGKVTTPALQVTTGSGTANQVLTSDVSGNATWVTPAAGVTLDSTASDIHALGTQSAGSSGQAARGDHVHPTTGVVLGANNGSDFADPGSTRANLHVPVLTPAAAVATTNITSLTTSTTTLDGYSLALADLVLLTAQSTGSQNGLWLVPASGSWTRPTEFASGAVIKGRTVLVMNGSAHANTQWALDTPTAGITIDTTSQTWAPAGFPLNAASTIRSTSGTPSVLASDQTGDFALDTSPTGAAAQVYGPFAGGAWPAGKLLAAPTQTALTNSTAIATTAYTDAAVATVSSRYWTVVTPSGNITATTWNLVQAGGAYTITLPLTPNVGDQVAVTRTNSSFTVTVAPNTSQTINGSATNISLPSGSASVNPNVVFVATSSTAWVILATAASDAGQGINVNGTLGINGSFKAHLSAKIASYTITAGDYALSFSGAGIVATFGTGLTTNQVIELVNIGASAVSMAAAGSGSIVGPTSLPANAGAHAYVQTSGANPVIYITSVQQDTSGVALSGTAASGNVPVASSASAATWTSLTAAQVTNAADKSSASAQVFTGQVTAPELAANLTGTVGRYVGTLTAAPGSGTYNTGDHGTDPTNLQMWICTAGGSPGSWTSFGSISATSPGVWQPSDDSLISAAFDYANAASNFTVVAGTIYLVRLWVRAATTITNVGFIYNGAAATAAGTYVALYSTAGNLFGVSTDQSTNFGATGGAKFGALSTPYSAAAGQYFAAFLVNSAGTVPQLARSAAVASVNFTRTGLNSRFASGTTGLTGAPPGSTTTGAALGDAIWAGFS
jgi:hypothetical protein